MEPLLSSNEKEDARNRFRFTIAFILFLFCSAVNSVQHYKWLNWSELECLCTSEYNPICASDMIRYRNACTFKCRQTVLKKRGKSLLEIRNCSDLPPTVPN